MFASVNGHMCRRCTIEFSLTLLRTLRPRVHKLYPAPSVTNSTHTGSQYRAW